MIDTLLIHSDFTVVPIFYICILFSCFILVTNEHPATTNKGEKKEREMEDILVSVQHICSPLFIV